MHNLQYGQPQRQLFVVNKANKMIWRKKQWKTLCHHITGQNHYLGMKCFKVRANSALVKDAENEFDSEAIRVKLPYVIGTIGYYA